MKKLLFACMILLVTEYSCTTKNNDDKLIKRIDKLEFRCDLLTKRCDSIEKLQLKSIKQVGNVINLVAKEADNREQYDVILLSRMNYLWNNVKVNYGIINN